MSKLAKQIMSTILALMTIAGLAGTAFAVKDYFAKSADFASFQGQVYDRWDNDRANALQERRWQLEQLNNPSSEVQNEMRRLQQEEQDLRNKIRQNQNQNERKN